jgi:hypothetical protein
MGVAARTSATVWNDERGMRMAGPTRARRARAVPRAGRRPGPDLWKARRGRKFHLPGQVFRGCGTLYHCQRLSPPTKGRGALPGAAIRRPPESCGWTALLSRQGRGWNDPGAPVWSNRRADKETLPVQCREHGVRSEEAARAIVRPLEAGPVNGSWLAGAPRLKLRLCKMRADKSN